LNHPNIARVFESGQTPEGRRFIVMELIEGQAIDKHVQSQHPPRRELLRHFSRICDAIAHAHGQGVLHHDLKPSNIMIARDGEVRVLDFGLARLIEASGVDESALTTSVRLGGTIPYVSPEQIEGGGEVLTVQSDVYSLGVLAYELLTGQLPFSLHASPKKTMDAICQGAYAPPARLDSSIDRDLSAIIETALHRDLASRYASAAELRDDVERYLAHRPVRARSISAPQRVSKMIRRHRVAFAVAAGIFFILLASTIASATLFLRARQAERLATMRLDMFRKASDAATLESRRFEAEARKSNTIAATLTRTLEMFHPLAIKPNRLTDSVLIDRISALVEQEMDEIPLVAADLHAALGGSLINRSHFESARHQFERSLELRTRHAPQDSASIGRGNFDLGTLYLDHHKYAEAMEYLRLSVDNYSRDPDRSATNLATARACYGASLIGLGRSDQGEDIASQAVHALHAQSGASAELAQVYERLADAHGHIGQHREAYAHMQESIALYRERNDRPDLVRTLTALVKFAHFLGRTEEAEARNLEAIQISKALIGETFPLLPLQLAQLSEISVDHDDIASADTAARGAVNLASSSSIQPPFDHCLTKIAGLAWIRGDYAEAERIYRELVARAVQDSGDNAESRICYTEALGVILRDKGEMAEAEELLRRAYSWRLSPRELDQSKFARAGNNLARFFFLTGQLSEAETFAQHAYQIRLAVFGSEHYEVGESELVLGMIQMRLGDLPAAHQHLERALAIRRATYPEDHYLVSEARSAMGEWLLETGDCEGGRAMLAAALQSMRRDMLETHLYITMTKQRLAAADLCSGLAESTDEVKVAMEPGR
jgi:serine/threonine-protein kinase